MRTIGIILFWLPAVVIAAVFLQGAWLRWKLGKDGLFVGGKVLDQVGSISLRPGGTLNLRVLQVDSEKKPVALKFSGHAWKSFYRLSSQHAAGLALLLERAGRLSRAHNFMKQRVGVIKLRSSPMLSQKLTVLVSERANEPVTIRVRGIAPLAYGVATYRLRDTDADLAAALIRHALAEGVHSY